MLLMLGLNPRIGMAFHTVIWNQHSEIYAGPFSSISQHNFTVNRQTKPNSIHHTQSAMFIFPVLMFAFYLSLYGKFSFYKTANSVFISIYKTCTIFYSFLVVIIIIIIITVRNRQLLAVAIQALNYQ